MSIPSISTRRPVAVWMLFLAIVLLGVISYVRLPIDLLPDVSYPRLVIYTVYEEVAPAEGSPSRSKQQPRPCLEWSGSRPRLGTA